MCCLTMSFWLPYLILPDLIARLLTFLLYTSMCVDAGGSRRRRGKAAAEEAASGEDNQQGGDGETEKDQ